MCGVRDVGVSVMPVVECATHQPYTQGIKAYEEVAGGNSTYMGSTSNLLYRESITTSVEATMPHDRAIGMETNDQELFTTAGKEIVPSCLIFPTDDATSVQTSPASCSSNTNLQEPPPGLRILGNIPLSGTKYNVQKALPDFGVCYEFVTIKGDSVSKNHNISASDLQQPNPIDPLLFAPSERETTTDVTQNQCARVPMAQIATNIEIENQNTSNPLLSLQLEQHTVKTGPPWRETTTITGVREEIAKLRLKYPQTGPVITYSNS
ncbi:hypothetical protein QAD02_021054 [Eretmocerus hayati]|uniref:Uncharacterized protein n=1 Tax=Eretmocerus hayati TaxID=131215 RepID=A0ACC2PQJ0_9HYME|nr:hypothetical protein QAD02_021054 [Eretmocerus hayati]